MDKEKTTRSSKKRKQEKGSALRLSWRDEVLCRFDSVAKREKPLGLPGFLVASRGPLEIYSETELDRPISKLFEVE